MPRIRRRGWRTAIFKRDKGVCSACGLDTGKLIPELQYRCYDIDVRGAYLARFGFPITHWDRIARSLWEADHVVPLIEGGADTLENLRTLCWPCHQKESTSGAARRAGKGAR